MEALTLQRTGNVAATNREQLMKLVYSNIGVNSNLFNGDQSSNQAILSSIKCDEIFVKPLNQIFENVLKYELKNKKKNSIWNVKMVGTTEYSLEAECSRALQGAMSGVGSKMKLMAINGYSPLESLNTLAFEDEHNIDALFIPLASSYTMSNKEDKGRPKNSENPNTSKGVGDDPNSIN